jgi:hypothetical protein
MPKRSWYDRFFKLFNISRRTAEMVGVAFGALAAIAFTVASIRGFLTNTSIKNPNDLLEMLGLYDATTDRVQVILRSVMRRTGSDRAFVFFYVENEQRVIESVFYDGYQQAGEGLQLIGKGHYSLGEGLGQARYDAHTKDECTSYATDDLDQEDALTQAFLRSNTAWAMSCPFFTRLDGQEVMAAIAVEFIELPYVDDEQENAVKVKTKFELMESSADVVRVMARSGVSK